MDLDLADFSDGGERSYSDDVRDEDLKAMRAMEEEEAEEVPADRMEEEEEAAAAEEEEEIQEEAEALQKEKEEWEDWLASGSSSDDDAENVSGENVSTRSPERGDVVDGRSVLGEISSNREPAVEKPKRKPGRCEGTLPMVPLGGCEVDGFQVTGGYVCKIEQVFDPRSVFTMDRGQLIRFIWRDARSVYRFRPGMDWMQILTSVYGDDWVSD